MSTLAIELRVEDGALRATYTNTGTTELALAFWWNRALRVVADTPAGSGSQLVEPGPGPVLPCGVAEVWTILAPGASVERAEPLVCTQPSGATARVGWSYDLAPEVYRIELVFEAPAAHGFSQSAPDPRAFVGRVESNAVTLEIAAPEPDGVMARIKRLVIP